MHTRACDVLSENGDRNTISAEGWLVGLPPRNAVQAEAASTSLVKNALAALRLRARMHIRHVPEATSQRCGAASARVLRQAGV